MNRISVYSCHDHYMTYKDLQRHRGWTLREHSVQGLPWTLRKPEILYFMKSRGLSI